MTALLARDKKHSRYLFDWSARWCLERAGSLDAITGQSATFTRAGTKTALDASGTLRTVPYGFPAFQWVSDVVSGLTVPAVLLEGASTNALLYSEQLDNAAWTKSAMTVTANNVPAPDGVVSADTCYETATNAPHYFEQAATGIADNTVMTASAWLTPSTIGVGRDSVQVVILRKDGTSITATYNLTTGATSGVSAGATARTTYHSATGMYRCEITGSVLAGGVQPIMRVNTLSGGSSTFLGDVTKGVTVWGAQFEASVSASSYCKTTSSTASRVADDCYWSYKVPPATSITVYCKMMLLQQLSALAQPTYLWNLGTVGVAPRLVQYFQQSDGAVAQYHHNGSSSVSATTNLVPALGDVVETAMTFSTAGVMQTQAAVNGGVIASSSTQSLTPAPAWSATRIALNKADGGLNGTAAYLALRVSAGSRSLAYMREG